MYRGLNQKRILVVDDIATNRDMVGRILRKAQYLIDYAENGEHALRLLESTNNYDLVLLDIEMPGINGFEVCQAMRQIPKLQELPVIFLTSYTKIENKVFGFGSGAQDYVTKPYSPEELLVRISTHIQLKHKSDLIKSMNETLVAKNKSITDSISYALHIQKALSPSTEMLDNTLKDYFLLNKPKDIISGDFFWFKQSGSFLYIAVADCTGHGVPGAFMSVLGISMLNEVIKANFFYSPNLILNELRKKIISSFSNESDSSSSKDGMDIALCLINLETLTMQYSGAYIPLVVMRKNPSKGSYELIKRLGDRMPVGRHPNEMVRFTNHNLELQQGDRIILFSDGYVSQFGGEEDKKFKSSRLRKELVEVQTYPIREQGQILGTIIEDWRGKSEQADDILVFGLEVSKKELVQYRDELK